MDNRKDSLVESFFVRFKYSVGGILTMLENILKEGDPYERRGIYNTDL